MCVVQCGAVWCSVVQSGAAWRSVLQCVTVCCRVSQCVAVCHSVLCCIVLQCVPEVVINLLGECGASCVGASGNMERWCASF